MTTPADDTRDLTPLVRQALTDYHKAQADSTPWQAWTLYHATQRSLGGASARQVINRMLIDAADELARSNAAHARLLQLRFFDDLPVHRVAPALSIAESTVYNHQRDAIAGLAALLARREAQARAALQTRLELRLPPPPYHHLVGFDAPIEALVRLVTQAGAPWLVAVEGIGGIGKTSLAYAALRQIATQGAAADIAWVTAKDVRLAMSGQVLPTDTPTFNATGLVHSLVSILLPEALSGGPLGAAQEMALLRRTLKQTPHVIVVDNLETVADWAAILSTLQQLADPTKFILTTRQSLHGEAGVFPLGMTELDDAYALQLLRREAHVSNLPEIERANDATLHPIVATVGGNPLALRLVVGLLHVHSLTTIVEDLRAARGMAVDNLYTYIYRRAWDALDEIGRYALLNMALLRPGGDTLEYIESISELSVHDLRSALQRLVTLNVVEARGDAHRRLYAIHSLTRTFLLNQVAKWMG